MNESSPTIYRIVLSCSGVPRHLGQEAAKDITEEFTHRAWHQNAVCAWDGVSPILQADNNYDEEGKALMDEFSDSISAYVSELFEGGIEVQSITVVDTGLSNQNERECLIE